MRITSLKKRLKYFHIIITALTLSGNTQKSNSVHEVPIIIESEKSNVLSHTLAFEGFPWLKYLIPNLQKKHPLYGAKIHHKG